MSDDLQLSPIITVDGRDLLHKWMMSLVEVHVTLEFHVPSRCTMRFIDPGFELSESTDFDIGTVVKVQPPTGGDPLVEAEVTAIDVQQRAGETPELVVTAYDKSHRLGRGTSAKTFLDMSFSDIVSQMAGGVGLSASVGSTKNKLDYLLQVDSDMALLNAMALRCGFDWWVEGSTLHFDAPSEGHEVKAKLSEDLLSFNVRASAVHPSAVKAHGWDRGQQTAIVGSATSTTTVVADSAIARKANSNSKFGTAEIMAASWTPVSSEEANQLSASLLDRMRRAAVNARGVIVPGKGTVKLGGIVNVDGAGPISGKYPVTKVEHVFRPGGFETRFFSGDRTPTSLVDTLGGAARPSPSTFRNPGLVPGVVTNINDPDKLGRVKVKFPSLNDTIESAWARIVAVGGGKNRGTVFIPEVNDEVLLGFEGGDLRQPVVLGGLYGAKSGIPSWDVADGKVTARKLTSRLGHFVELADGQADTDQFILVALNGEKHKLRIGKDRADIEMPSGKPVLIKAGNTKIEFAADGSVTIHGASITLKADQKIALEAPQIDVKANAQLNVQSSGPAALKGAITNVESQGPLALKGAIVQIN